MGGSKLDGLGPNGPGLRVDTSTIVGVDGFDDEQESR
jgi:hypothetical protein